ncbi:MAG: peptide ABC transporter substrate-binding protein [Gammaproteobacteria bacterium]|nr:peptide ABC transporter substrate-binding protein [Gammaproteobacteria bacterium]
MRILLAALLLSAISQAMAQVNASSIDYDTQTITIALAQEPPQLNSMKATDQVSILLLGHVMEGLTRYGRRNDIKPGVAERWKINDKDATFWLRKDAMWSDGVGVTAHDFVFAWQNALDPATASEYAFILYPIKNAEEINKGNLPTSQLGVTAVGDYTLKIELERPTQYFLKLTAFSTYFPVRRNFFESRGDRFASEASDLVYNGPFRITDWVHSASLRMARNDHYWDRDNITLNAINADYITEDTRTHFNLFIDGRIAITGLNGETYKDALTQKFRIRLFTTGSVFFLEYNHRPERITSNVNIRRAIQHVFDPTEMVNKVLATPGNLAGESLFPVWLAGVKGKFRSEYPAPLPTLDLKKAKEYLDKAKQELGLDEIPALILLVGDSPTASKQSEYLQGLLKSKLDLDIKIDTQTFKQRLSKMTSGDFDIVGAGWGPDFDDIMTFGDLFASWNLNNRGRYENAEYDRNVRTAMDSLDPKIRMDAMAELQRILYEDAVILPQYEQGIIYLQHPKLKGVVRRVVGPDPDYTYARVVE